MPVAWQPISHASDARPHTPLLLSSPQAFPGFTVDNTLSLSAAGSPARLMPRVLLWKLIKMVDGVATFDGAERLKGLQPSLYRAAIPQFAAMADQLHRQHVETMPASCAPLPTPNVTGAALSLHTRRHAPQVCKRLSDDESTNGRYAEWAAAFGCDEQADQSPRTKYTFASPRAVATENSL